MSNLSPENTPENTPDAPENNAIENVVIIGSGPAGFTAAIYAARANLKPMIFEGYQDGGLPGGQLMTTTEVENFPGFPEGITGPELMDRMKAQAVRWGSELYMEDVVAVDLSQRPFAVRSSDCGNRSYDRTIKTHSIIIATGATAKRLGLPSEHIYWSRGISACAICDGATPIFKGEELVVVGAGDSAAEEAVYLTKYGSHVHMLVRRGEMRASKAMQDRVLSNPKVTVHWHTEPVDVVGENNRMTGVQVKNTQTNVETIIPAKGLFYAVGHKPNTGLFQGQLALDEVGYIVTQHDSVATSVAGVFACGDVQDHEYRQAITAAGTGCMAALLAERWLSAEKLIQEFHQVPEVEKAPMVGSTTLTDRPPEISTDRPQSTPEERYNPASTHHQGGYALRKLFHDSDRLIMVKYSSPSCGPCHTLKTILSKVVEEFDGKMHYIEIDIEDDPDIAKNAGVTGTPTIQFFKHKEMVTELKGVKPKSQYRQLIESNL